MNNESYEITRENVDGFDNNLILFLKWNYVDTKKLKKFKDSIKNDRKKYKVLYGAAEESDTKIDKDYIHQLSGVMDSDNNLKKYIDTLIPYSFALKAKIELKAPYYSADDDKFYLIQNPCLKETVFKFAMIRGSAWKGAIAKAAKELMSEKLNGKADNCQLSFRECVQSYLRIFGTGSDEFRNIEAMIEEYVKDKSKKLDFKKLIVFLLFELGLKLGNGDIEEIKDPDKVEVWIKNKIWEEFKVNPNAEIPVFLQTHKGRAIFYPSYFDTLSVEVINPHDRKKRAGTSPVHYEVVPQGESTVLQIIYMPFDGVLTENKDLETEVKNDIQLLAKSLEKLAYTGIGAKTKLGWGRFELNNKMYAVNLQDSKANNFNNIINGWNKIV